MAAFFATAAALARRVQDAKKVLSGDISIGEFLSPGRAIDQFSEDFAAALGKVKTDFQEVFDPAAAAGGVTPFFDAAADATGEGVDDIAKELERLEEKKADALKGFGEGVEDAEIDFQRDLQKIDLEAERKRTDILLNGARDREAAAKKHLEELADIRLNHSQEVEDAERDLSRTEAQIARNAAADRLELEQDTRQKRLDVETDYRQKLEDITRTADLDLEEAERNRDVVSFLRILRKKQADINTAQIERQRSIDGLRIETEQRKAELERRRQSELEQARIQHQQALEDLQISLEREIEAQNTAHARTLENINIAEAEKLADLQTWRERERQDAQTAFDQKLQDLELNLQRELDLIKAHTAEIQKEAQKQQQALAEVASAGTSSKKKPTKKSGYASGGSIGADSPGFKSGGSIGKQFGGLVNAGQSYPVGERGPELFTPNANGRIIPNNALVMPSMTPKSVINNISNSRTNAPAVNFPVGDASLFNDPIFTAKLRNYVLSMIDGVS